ncbi:Asp/Glu/hydantoin racemase [Xylariaceae sp. FL0804]|nr:Asp/Glu/hydantoin racemase [Xylariaceae sp. FL0804]
MESTLPSVTGSSDKPINILLINPNSTESMTLACLRSVSASLPPHVTVTGFTAPGTAPSAVEGRLDAVLSAADCARALAPLVAAHRYDAFLVACFSAHPLIPALREEYAQPCIGIMEAALYAARLCGDRLGVVTTSARSAALHGQAVATTYGLNAAAFSAGGAAADVSVLELEGRPRADVHGAMARAARELVDNRGADCVCLGCAGMTEMAEACRDAVGGEGRAMVIDGVAMGVHFLVGLVREGLGTAKGGSYRSSRAGRERRGQEWL